MKRIIIISLFMILSSTSGVFAYSGTSGQSFDGNGNPEYPNSGVLWAEEEGSYPPESNGYKSSSSYNNAGYLIYYKAYGCIYANNSDTEITNSIKYQCTISDLDILNKDNQEFVDNFFDSATLSGSITDTISAGSFLQINYNSYCHGTVYTVIYMSPYPIVNYTLSGDTCGTTSVDIYLVSGTDNILIDKKTLMEEDSYSTEIVKGVTYLVKFSNGHQYEFTCDGDEIYDYSLCNYCIININDNCANLLNSAFVVVYNEDTDMNVVYSGYNNPISISAYDVSENDKLVVIWSTWYTGVQKTCFAQFDHDINLFDPLVFWEMDVNVYDNASNPLEDVNVDFNQDCVINGYPPRNKYTDVNGYTYFTECENKNAILTVSKDGYQTLTETISGGWYDVHQNTYEISVILQSSSDTGNNSNSTVYNDTVNDTNATEISEDIPNWGGIPESIQLYFRDVNGAYTTEVKDTDDYVNCYYSVKSSDPLYMTLKFQESPNGWDWFDVHTYGYSIDNNSYGYFHIPNSYFNDSTLTYRAYIYDNDYYFSDRYAYLSVVNETNDSETHYDNLTGMCMFMHRQINNTIDYREDIVCYILINANTNALKTVSLELYKEDILIDYKNLTYNDFNDADIYGWYLGYTYEANYNYSLVLKASDGSILDTDNIRAINNIGNKLTIKVTDSFNHDLTNVYVFCEHYGSINTGYLNYGAFEGLPDGETRYKASKSGYRSGIWSTVNLTDENEVVTYQLIQEKSEGSVSAIRMSDDSVKDLYYPFMYFLLIIILIGGLLHVVK